MKSPREWSARVRLTFTATTRAKTKQAAHDHLSTLTLHALLNRIDPGSSRLRVRMNKR